MDRKAKIILNRAEKAGVRRSLKEGHVLTEQELLNLKVQILSARWRISLALAAIASTIGSYVQWGQISGVLLALLSLLFLLFAVFGVRRTLSRILDTMDVIDAAELLGAVAKGVASVAAAILE